MPRRNEPLERCCALTRETRPVTELIRFVAGPDGKIVPDLKRQLPGRGVWVSATHAAVSAAQKKRVFARSLKEQVTADEDLAERVDALLERAALNSVSLARKAGQVLAGFAKVEAALKSADVIALLLAADAGEDGVRKLSAIAKARFAGSGGCRTLRSFASTQLDLALGRSNVIHAALLAGSASENALMRIDALERFRANPDEQSGGAAGGAATQD